MEDQVNKQRAHTAVTGVKRGYLECVVGDDDVSERGNANGDSDSGVNAKRSERSQPARCERKNERTKQDGGCPEVNQVAAQDHANSSQLCRPTIATTSAGSSSVGSGTWILLRMR